MKVSVLGAVVAMAATLVFPGSAQADPAGTVAVNRIPSLMPRITILGASSAGMLYKVERPPYLGGNQWTYVKPASGAAYEVSNDFKVLAGDKAYAPYTADGRVHYLIVGSTVVRRCDSSPQPTMDEYRGAHFARFTPFGWLSDTTQRIAADATGCRVIGDAPGIQSFNLGASDGTGYVLVGDDGSGDMTLEYRSYAAPNQPVPIQTGGRSRFLGALDLAGDAITWSQLDYDNLQSHSSYVVRSSTTGGPATVTRVAGMGVGTTAIAGAATGWAGCNEGYTDCRAGTIGSTGDLPGTYSIDSDGSRFLVDTYDSSPGIDAMQVVATGQPRTRVVTVGLVPPETFAVAVGASTVTYVDNQLGMTGETPRYTLSRRSFNPSLSLSAQKSLGQVGADRVARDGRRTAYVDTAGDLWLITDDGVRTRVFDAVAQVTAVASAEPLPFRLSGHRLLWVKDTNPGYFFLRLMLYDIRTGRNTDLGPYSVTQPAALWGSYLVYTDTSNRILRKDLSSGAVVQVKGAGPRVAGLDVNLTIVGWSTCAGTDNFGNCATSRIGYRVMTGLSIVERASTHTGAVRMTGGYLAYSTQLTLGDRPLLKAWRLGTSSITTIGALGGQFADMHDQTVAWYGPDKIAKLTPLAPFTARPRYLGNALGSSTFTPNGDGRGDVWAPEFAISKALPTCRVTITSGTTLRRSLSCATTVGSARVVWNGRDPTGRLLPKGRYTWTLTGSDADGSLVWWTGSATPIRGTVTIA